MCLSQRVRKGCASILKIIPRRLTVNSVESQIHFSACNMRYNPIMSSPVYIRSNGWICIQNQLFTRILAGLITLFTITSFMPSQINAYRRTKTDRVRLTVAVAVEAPKRAHEPRAVQTVLGRSPVNRSNASPIITVEVAETTVHLTRCGDKDFT